jgi:[ribosomal protein S18]-alanine N-acetyltransferase
VNKLSSKPAAPSAPRLRRATLRDLPAILDLEHLSFPRPQEQFPRRTIRRLIQNPRAEVYVAVRRGHLLGWIAGLVVRRGQRLRGRIYAIAVHPHSRGLHLGQKLMARAIRQLTTRGAELLSLEVRHDNAGALALYHKLGFQINQHLPDYYGPRYHGVRMMRSVR